MVVCAHELGVELDAVRNMNTSTEKVPNTSPTAASSGSDLNGQAVKAACRKIMDRIRPLAARMLACSEGLSGELRFEGGQVWHPDSSGQRISFASLCQQAWVEQISLSAAGYYSTPGIAYDHSTGQGTPFFYFAYGAAITEVEISCLTGEYRILRADILHDAGDSLVPSIDLGQVEGAYVQGLGWLSNEELLFNRQGRLLTYSPSTYKIPAMGDIPTDFRVGLLQHAPQEEVIHGSKAVGEPPFMLAISLVTALRMAICSAGASGEAELALPATYEAVLRAIAHQRGQTVSARNDVVIA
jgi:xanthine dehydrogenase large subunit